MPSINVPKMNQNVLVLAIALTGLYFSELQHLKSLYCITLIISIIIGFEVIVSMSYYTLDYVQGKLWSARDGKKSNRD